MYRIKRGTRNKPALKSQYENKAYEFVKGILWNRPQFNGFLSGRWRNYALKNQGNLKGFAVLSEPRTNGSWVLELIGTEATPGKGYGKALMNRIKNNAARKGSKLVIIHDPVGPARGFYRKLGATSVTKQLSNMTSLMRLPTGAKRKRSASPTSRRRATPNRQRSPSRPSPKQPSSSPRSSARRSVNGRSPRS